MLTDLSFLAAGQPWPPACEKERLDRYEDNRLLFTGKHDEVLGDFVRLVRDDQRAVLELVLNLFKRISTLFADLLVGEAPRFKAGDDGSPEQKTVTQLVALTGLLVAAYEAALDVSRYGDGLFKLGIDAGVPVIECQPPTLWFPVVSPDNLRRVQAHVLAWQFDVQRSGLKSAFAEKDRYLRAEVHYPGRIENRLFALSPSKQIERELKITEMFPDRQPVEATGVKDFLVVPVAGLRTSDAYHGQDDYTDVITIVQEMSLRLAQIGRILDKHSDPSMYGPEDAVKRDPQTGQAILPGGGKYFKMAPGDTIQPGYVVWDAQLTAAFDELEQLWHAFYTTAEISPAAFGDVKTGQIASGAALRRLMQPTLAKVNRVKGRMEPAMIAALRTTAELMRANGLEATELKDISITFRDGLPEDPIEASQVEATVRGAGVRSRYAAIKQLYGGSDAEIQQEIDRITEEEANQAGMQPAGMPGRKLTMQYPESQPANAGSTNDRRTAGQG